LDTSEKYFRDPKGYFFNISDSQLINTQSTPVVFNLEQRSSQISAQLGSATSSQVTDDGLIPPPTSPPPIVLKRIADLSAPVRQSSGNSILSGAGYHYMWPFSSLNNGGMWGRFTVVNPGVDHSGSVTQHFVKRAMASTGGLTPPWMEIGWGEFSWRDDTQYTYEYDTIDGYSYYDLPTGSTLEVAVVHVANTTNWYDTHYSTNFILFMFISTSRPGNELWHNWGNREGGTIAAVALARQYAMKRLVSVLAVLTALVVPLFGCGKPYPIERILLFKDTAGIPPTGPFNIGPPDPFAAQVQLTVRPGDRIFAIIRVSRKTKGDVTISRYTFFNTRTSQEHEIAALPVDLGPFHAGDIRPVALDHAWPVPERSGAYEFRIYLGDEVVASALFEVKQ
jgi:hypothetical protein